MFILSMCLTMYVLKVRDGCIYWRVYYLFVCVYLKFHIVEYKALKYQIYLKRRFLLHCLQFSRKFIYRTYSTLCMIVRQLLMCQMVNYKKKPHICVTVASKILKYVLSFEMLLEGKCRLIKN